MYENIRYMLKAVFSADFGMQEKVAKSIYIGSLKSSGKVDWMRAELLAALEDGNISWRAMLLNDEYEVLEFEAEEDSIEYVKRVLLAPLNL